jgi:hypothetical protein
VGGKRGRNILLARLLNTPDDGQDDRLAVEWFADQSRDKRTDYQLRRSRQVHRFRSRLWAECVELLMRILDMPAGRAEVVVSQLLANRDRDVSVRTIQRARSRAEQDEAYLAKLPIGDLEYLARIASRPPSRDNPDLGPEYGTWQAVVLACWSQAEAQHHNELPIPTWDSSGRRILPTVEHLAFARNLGLLQLQTLRRMQLVAKPHRQLGRPRRSL